MIRSSGCPVDHRAGDGRRLERIADGDGLGDLRDPADHLIVDRLVHEHPGRQRASLAAEHRDGQERAVRAGGVEVGVVEDDVGRLAAELKAGGLHRVGAAVQDLPGGVRAAGERHLLHQRVTDERRAGLGRARQDVHHAGREARLLDQVGEQLAGERGQLRRLDHDRVTRRQRRGDLHRQRDKRAVPGDDDADHAVGLGEGVADLAVLGVEGVQVAVDLVGPARVVPRPFGRLRHEAA